MNEILLDVYKESNEHLRASDNKRDQTIAFYLIIIGLFFGSLDKFNGNLTTFVTLAISLLGIVLALSILSLRK
ncbi:MAG TPA: hypothetical protein ENH11_03505 [Candidatus Acetothermia bacterium]|nr:hypothetical protein [Candidatus Acetothermia bacterium]